MLKTRQLLIIFVPALLVAAFGLFIKVVQYSPLLPKSEPNSPTEKFTVPILAEDPIIGDKKAPITLVAFEDFGCEACRNADSLLKSVMQKYPSRLKIIWKGVPVAHFPVDTKTAHIYAYCSRAQGKFLEFKEYAFLNSDQLTEENIKLIAGKIPLDTKKLAACLDSGAAEKYITNAEMLADSLNIQSLPAFFVDNKQIQSGGSVEAWETVLGLN